MISILAGSCIFNCQYDDARPTCDGFSELKADDKPIFKLTQEERSQGARAYSKIIPKVNVKQLKRSKKVLNTQGNCCWVFYQRYVLLHFFSIFFTDLTSLNSRIYYRGLKKILRGSQRIDLNFIPRSMKLIEC